MGTDTYINIQNFLVRMSTILICALATQNLNAPWLKENATNEYEYTENWMVMSADSNNIWSSSKERNQMIIH